MIGLPACGSDDAKHVQRDLDHDAGTVDERAKDAANDAKDKVKTAVEDVDGQ